MTKLLELLRKSSSVTRILREILQKIYAFAALDMPQSDILPKPNFKPLSNATRLFLLSFRSNNPTPIKE
jgi:hypothetical protein